MNEDFEKLGKLQDYFAQYKALPSYRYMGELLNIKSTETVSKLITKLKDEQYLDTAPDNKLMPGKRFFEIPYTDEAVQAGPFTDSYAQGGGHISLLDILIKKPSITRIRRVSGNSMSDLGILDNDWAVYEQRQDAKIGEIVIAVLDGSSEVTIKELGRQNGEFVLIPHNPNFDIIRPKKPFYVEGVLLSSFRTY